MEILRVAFILAEVFILGSGRVITSEESSRDTIDEELEKQILNEKNGESSAQIEGFGVFRLTDEALLESPETLSYDARSESTNEHVEASDYLSAPPKQTATRRGKRSVVPPEPSCFSGKYEIKTLSQYVTVKVPVCSDVASARGKCLGDTFREYGKRACAPSHYVKVIIGVGISQAVPTNCSCRVK